MKICCLVRVSKGNNQKGYKLKLIITFLDGNQLYFKKVKRYYFEATFLCVETKSLTIIPSKNIRTITIK